MKSIVLLTSAFALAGLLLSGSSAILPKSYASIFNPLNGDISELNDQISSSMNDNKDKWMQTGQYFLNGLYADEINDDWLEDHGLDGDLLEGIDQSMLAVATHHVMNGLNNEEIDQEWIENSMLDDGYGGAFVLILVLFILLVIIGAGFGLGETTEVETTN